MNENPDFAPLSSDERKILASFLDSDHVHEETFDFVQLHGFLTALAIAPVAISDEEWLEAVFVKPPRYTNAVEQSLLDALIRRLGNAIARDLYSGEPLKLPCSLNLGKNPDEAPLRGWAMGFMEAVHLREEQWFDEDADDDEMGELILPIAMASGMFEDESMDHIYEDEELVKELCNQIPETLSDLYLYFRGADADE